MMSMTVYVSECVLVSVYTCLDVCVWTRTLKNSGSNMNEKETSIYAAVDFTGSAVPPHRLLHDCFPTSLFSHTSCRIYSMLFPEVTPQETLAEHSHDPCIVLLLAAKQKF